MFIPIKSDIQPFPESRLELVSCECKSTSKNVYRKNLCLHRKHGFRCIVACGKFRGESCGNYVDSTEEDYDADIFEKNLFDLFD